MAFAPPRYQSVVQLIGNLENEQALCSRVTNLTRKLTLTLKQTYVEILATKSFPSSFSKFSTTFPTDEMGYLLIGQSFPILLKRYRLAEVIALGTFSQIFRAIDLFRDKEVAVKVMRIGYSLLGLREHSMLQHMARRTMRGTQLYAACLDSFVFEDHYCIVLELYDSTLLSLLRNVSDPPESSADSNNGSHKVHNKGSGIQIVQPKVHRPIASGKVSLQVLDTTHIPRSNDTAQSTVGINPKGMRNLKHIALKLVSAMHVLRMEGIIHADIKPENCFINMRHEHDLSTSTDAHNSSTLKALNHINSLDTDTLVVRLGDMGNSIHTSEIPQYYSEFGIQSLPYRAPEVLLGLPFTAAIDMWSLGVLLVELCTGTTLFAGRSREDMLSLISQKLAPLCPVTFSGGMYSHLLSEVSNSNLLVAPQSVHSSSTYGSTYGSAYRNTYSTNSNTTAGVSYSSRAVTVPFAYANHLKCVKRLLTRALPASSHSLISSDFLHFIAGLLMPDPKLRLTPLEALTHPFLCDTISIPLQLLSAGGDSNKNVYDKGGTMSSAGGARSARSATASISQLRRLTVSTLIPVEARRKAAPIVPAVKVERVEKVVKVEISSENTITKGGKGVNRNKYDEIAELTVDSANYIHTAKRKARDHSEPAEPARNVVDTTARNSGSSASSGAKRAPVPVPAVADTSITTSSASAVAAASSAGRGQSGNNTFMALFSPPAKPVSASNSNFARLQSTLQSSLHSAQQGSTGVNGSSGGTQKRRGDDGAAEHKQPEGRDTKKPKSDEANGSAVSKFSKFLN